MTTSSVSKLTAQEAYGILSTVYGTSPWTLAQIEADMARVETAYYSVAEAGKVVGILALQELAGELEITQLAVLPDYQGKGYGWQLLGALADRKEPVFLEVRASNKPAIALYRKAGFEKVGERKNYYHNPVEDAVLMTRANVLWSSDEQE